jgi:hypothetical protein
MLVDRLADKAQTDRLERAGYFVGRVTETMVWMRPHQVLEAAHHARERIPYDPAATATSRSGHASSTYA